MPCLFACKTMDFVLLIASTCLPTYLPTCVGHVSSKSRFSSIKIVLGLSLCLLSLSVLEVSPSQWMMVLRHRDRKIHHRSLDEEKSIGFGTNADVFHHHIITVSSAYRFLFCVMSVLILLILPSIIGVKVLGHLNMGNFLSEIYPSPSSSPLTSPVSGNGTSANLFDPQEHKKQQRSVLRVSLSTSASTRRQSLAHWSLRFLYRILWIMIGLLQLLTSVLRTLCFRHRTSHAMLPLTQPPDSATTTTTNMKARSRHLRFPLRFFVPSQICLGIICGVTATVAILSTLAPLAIRMSRDDGEIGGTATTETTATAATLATAIASTRWSIYSQGLPFLTTAVSWMCAVGLLISAILNGFGSVSMPHSCLAGLYLEPIRPEAIAHAESELEKALETLEDRRAQLSSQSGFGTINVMQQQSSSSQPPRVASFADLGEEIVQRRKLLVTEISFLETLVDELTEDVAEMRQSQQMANQARTPMGRLRSWLGVIFSIILLLKLASAVASTWPSTAAANDNFGTLHQQHSKHHRHLRHHHKDIVTMTLLWLVGHHYVSHEEYATLSHFISLSLTAILSLLQINTFLQTVSAVNRRMQTFYRKCYSQKAFLRNERRKLSLDVDNNNGSTAVSTTDDPMMGIIPTKPNTIYNHIVACLMGNYFLACIVLTKKMLPERYRMGFTAALGGQDFDVRPYAINFTFVLSALVSAAVLGMLLAIQRKNTHRHQKSMWTTPDSELISSKASDV